MALWGIQWIQHLEALSDTKKSESIEKFEKLNNLENEKKLILAHVKSISKNLNRVKTQTKKNNILLQRTSLIYSTLIRFNHLIHYAKNSI
jgi:hypothetical protein